MDRTDEEVIEDALRDAELRMQKLGSTTGKTAAGAYSLFLYLHTQTGKRSIFRTKGDVEMFKVNSEVAWEAREVQARCPKLWKNIREALRKYKVFFKICQDLAEFWADRPAANFIRSVKSYRRNELKQCWNLLGVVAAEQRYLFLVNLFADANDEGMGQISEGMKSMIDDLIRLGIRTRPSLPAPSTSPHATSQRRDVRHPVPTSSSNATRGTQQREDRSTTARRKSSGRSKSNCVVMSLSHPFTPISRSLLV
ncbi:uncharacterized protein JCM6883_003475 [Sporobolomyces salmoneus]|uniref:uncharacterized protein n=1 Tax=Sporobolomyces salmoneus TaxID=183962 RepID=UPI003173E46F